MLDLDSYSARAEGFLEALDREHYLHGAGHKPDLEVEAIYAAHAELFQPAVIAELRREVADRRGEALRRARHLLHFALEGLIGSETRAEAEEIARLESSLEVEVEGDAVPFRMVPVEQANEPDRGRREALERARNELVADRLGPPHRRALERGHAVVAEQGWGSYAEAFAEVRGIDLADLATQVEGLLVQTADRYAEICDPALEATVDSRLGEARRSELPRFFRGAHLDPLFAAERLVPSLEETMAGLGLDLASQSNIHLDTERRPTKSPRAFCATPRVPEEVYLVVSPIGGREDYAALFHEAGHAEHYGNVDPRLPFADRQLGDNSVTESFAFLLEGLTWSEAWLRAVLDAPEPGAAISHARAVELLMLRRYAAKIAYELDLHGPDRDLTAMPERYAALLGEATRIGWPPQLWLSDVDGGFYVACYLRAWALERHWERALRRRWGERWFESPEAGAWLREVWRQGQRLDGEELLAESLGEELDFGLLAEHLQSG